VIGGELRPRQTSLRAKAIGPTKPGRYAIRQHGFQTEAEYTTDHLAGLGRVWGAATFFPLVEVAPTPAEYRDAVNILLQALNDPATEAEVAAIPIPRAASAIR